jgi:hypothetical protein
VKLQAWIFGVSVLFVVGGTAAAGGNNKYPWCAGLGNGQGHVTEGDKFSFNSDADDIAGGGNALYDVALASCGHMISDSDAYAGPLTAARARWSKRLELTEADWKDVAAYTALEQYERQGTKLERLDITKRTYESLTPLEQFSLVQHGPSAGGAVQILDPAWSADVLGSHLSATGRLAFLMQCTGATDPVVMAHCAPDAALFDAHKVFEELRADTSANAGMRVAVRLFADDMRRAIPKFQARVAALVKQDPAYGKMFELATQTAKQWEAMYAAHDPDVDLALQLDNARVTNSRKAFEGCAARTREAWLKSVSAIPAKRFAKMYDSSDGTQRFANQGLPAVLQTPDGYLAGLAMALCASDAKDETLGELANRIAALCQRWAGNRGPRNGIVSAVIAADLKFDDRDVELKQPTDYRAWIGSGPPGHLNRGGLGVIKKLVAKADKLHIEFVMAPGTMEVCAEGGFSHRIEAIRGDGTIQYHHDCRKWKTVKTEEGSRPTDIEASFAGALKAGMKVSISNGIVDAAWATEKSETPIVVFGAPVK